MNARIEKFCHLVAGGMSQTDAYAQAQGRPRMRGDKVTASKVARQVEVRKRIAEIRAGLCRDMAKVELRNLEDRILAATGRMEKIYQVIEERSQDPSLASIPGGKTGIVLKSGRTDVRLLDAALKIELAVAKQLGQITDKIEHSGINGGPIEITTEFWARAEARFTEDELRIFIELLRKLHREDDPELGDGGSGPENTGA